MKGWRLGWAWIALLGIAILLTAADNPSLLKDTDTRVLLERMSERNDPLSWWVGDWPLFNHFYRPMVTMVFEFDQRLHPWDPAGFGFTNAVLCAGCVLALFWLLRELTDDLAVAASATTLFGLWTAFPGLTQHLPTLVMPLGLIGLVLGLIRRNWGLAVLSFLFAVIIAPELAGLEVVRGGTMDWIPGRTATTMTLFAFLALAAYARYERLTAKLRPTEPSPFDIPATRSTTVTQAPSKWVAAWLGVALISAALAFASYEQAVMLPALFMGVAVTFWLLGRRPHWVPALASWGLVVLYLAIRRAVLPEGVSQYQDQQFRHSLDVFFTICDYAFPAAREIYAIANQVELGLFTILLTQQKAMLSVLAHAVGYPMMALAKSCRWLTRNEWAWLLSGYAMSILAFLPMAWLKPFPAYNHYHYFSMGFRSLFAVVAVTLLVRVAISVVSPQGRQAPQRPTPAPGSLLHP